MLGARARDPDGRASRSTPHDAGHYREPYVSIFNAVHGQYQLDPFTTLVLAFPDHVARRSKPPWRRDDGSARIHVTVRGRELTARAQAEFRIIPNSDRDREVAKCRTGGLPGTPTITGSVAPEKYGRRPGGGERRTPRCRATAGVAEQSQKSSSGAPASSGGRTMRITTTRCRLKLSPSTHVRGPRG